MDARQRNLNEINESGPESGGKLSKMGLGALP